MTCSAIERRPGRDCFFLQVGILPVRQNNVVAVTTGVCECSLMLKHFGTETDEGASLEISSADRGSQRVLDSHSGDGDGKDSTRSFAEDAVELHCINVG